VVDFEPGTRRRVGGAVLVSPGSLASLCIDAAAVHFERVGPPRLDGLPPFLLQLLANRLSVLQLLSRDICSEFAEVGSNGCSGSSSNGSGGGGGGSGGGGGGGSSGGDSDRGEGGSSESIGGGSGRVPRDTIAAELTPLPFAFSGTGLQSIAMDGEGNDPATTVRPSWFPKTLHLMQSLTCLELTRCASMVDEQLAEALRRMPLLEMLSVERCRALEGTFLGAIVAGEPSWILALPHSFFWVSYHPAVFDLERLLCSHQFWCLLLALGRVCC
jgi:hypothetical protein